MKHSLRKYVKLSLLTVSFCNHLKLFKDTDSATRQHGSMRIRIINPAYESFRSNLDRDPGLVDPDLFNNKQKKI
jgi:hypothetical protein